MVEKEILSGKLAEEDFAKGFCFFPSWHNPHDYTFPIPHTFYVSHTYIIIYALYSIAETGSGKTLAFSLPALTALSTETLPHGKRRTPRMLVLAPTRELAMQSHVVIEEFGSLVDLSALVVYGGVPKHVQKDTLRKGVDCIVATPGRIKDLINEGACNLSKVSQLVLAPTGPKKKIAIKQAL